MKKLLKLAKYLGYSIYAMCGVLLLVFLVPVSGWKALTVATGSMNPAIAPGSLVIIHAAKPNDLKIGDVATYINPSNQSQTITHRIVKVASEAPPRSFIFKGDANPAPDPHPIVAGRVVGKVEWHVPVLGRIVALLKQPLGLAIVIIIPGLLVIIGELRILGKALYSKPESKTISSTEPPAQVPTPVIPVPEIPPTPLAASIPTPKAQSRRSVDGMRPLVFLGLVLVALASVGHTYAKLSTRAELVHNSVTTLGGLPVSDQDCKNGGWKKFKNTDGTPIFKNQGQCVSFMESHKHDSDKDHGQDNDNSKNNKHNQDDRANSSAKNSKDDHRNGFSDSRGDSDRHDDVSRSA